MEFNSLVWDIETAASKRGLMYLNDVAPIKVDSRIKDPEKIEAKREENRKKLIEKAALYWWTGKVHTICVRDLRTGDKHTFQNLTNEKKLLTEFFTYLAEEKPSHILTGKSSKNFDEPYVVGRALYHDIGLVSHLRSARPITDIDNIFGYRNEQQTTLNNYAFGIGIPTKTSTGGNVQKMYDEKLTKEIETYCEHDVFIVYEMLRRYQKPFAVLGKEVQAQQVNLNNIF